MVFLFRSCSPSGVALRWLAGLTFTATATATNASTTQQKCSPSLLTEPQFLQFSHLRMGLLGALGSVARFLSSAPTNSTFLLLRTPLFVQFLDICFLNYPDPLDLYAWSFEMVPLYFLAGAMDFGIMTLVLSLYAPWAVIVRRKVTTAEAGPLLLHLQSPRSRAFRGLLLASFLLRAWKLGLGNIKRTCNLNLLQWREMRKLSVLILILCPALFWHWLSETILSVVKLDQNVPWLAQFTWFLLSGDWETATLYSKIFAASKGKEVLRQENISRISNTWTDFLTTVLKKTAIALPMELFVRNFGYIVLAMVFAVGRNGPAIIGFIARFVRKLKGLGIVGNLMKIDETVSLKRDDALMLLVRYLRRASVSWWRTVFLKHVDDFGRLLDAPLKHLSLGSKLYFEQTVSSLQQKIKSTLHGTRLGQYFNLDSTPKELPRRRFRLLEVGPSSSYDRVITCNLAWYDLGSAPPYTAISYVWGSSEHNSTILLNGKEYKATASALIALKGLRSKWRKKKFWIDAICIDQTSDTDKAEQIAIMADIYRNAKQVTVWLGPDEHGALALSLVRRLWIRTRIKDVMGASSYSLDAPEPAWKAFQRLMQSPWFQRSWVVQEVMSSNVVVQYGDAKLDWTILSRFSMAVENESRIMQKLYSLAGRKGRWSSQMNPLQIRYIRIIEEFRSMHSRKEQHLSLLFYLIRMFRSNCRFKATNKQDRIYAVLNLSGLAGDSNFNALLNVSGLLGNKNTQNTPDYNQRLSKFYTTVARYFLASGPENRRLDFLSHAGTCYTYGRDRLPDLPSWAPDWSLENPSTLPLIGHDGTLELLQHPRIKGILEDVADLQSYDDPSLHDRPEKEVVLKKLNTIANVMIEKTIYRASKETLPNFTLLEGPENMLELSGYFIDRLYKVGVVFPSLLAEPSSSNGDHLVSVTEVLFSWYMLAFSSFHLSHTVDSEETRLLYATVFYQTLLADLSHPKFDFTLPSAPVRGTSAVKAGGGGLIVGVAAGVIPMDPRPGGEAGLRMVDDFITHVNVVCAGRVFGVTESGRMGLFPVGCGVGDEVWVLEGAGLPFVVSRMGESVLEETERPPEGDDDMKDEDGYENEIEEEEVRGEGKRPLYELVGAAYVQGIMDGEGINETGTRTKILLK
jgi:hypothetical protein